MAGLAAAGHGRIDSMAAFPPDTTANAGGRSVMRPKMTMPAEQDEMTSVRPLKLPRVADAAPVEAPAHSERNPVFSLLVQNETDTTGLLAYALYKQNKRDWLIAHRARDGREPTSSELDAYILGESIPRRIATYRRLAEDMLVSDVTEMRRPGLLNGLMAPANDAAAPRAIAAQAAKQTITWKYIAFLLGMLVVMAVLFRLAAGWLFGTGR
jgi:hypothetical protein